MADHDGYCQTCKWCVSWTQQEQHPRAGATPNVAGQFMQTDYEVVSIAHYQCRRYPPQVFGDATVQPAGYWRQAFPGMQATEWCGEYAAREGAQAT